MITTQTLVAVIIYMLIVAMILFVVSQVKKKRVALHAKEMKEERDAEAFADRILYGNNSILATTEHIELDVVEEGRRAYFTLQTIEKNPYKNSLPKSIAWDIGWLEAQLRHLYRASH